MGIKATQCQYVTKRNAEEMGVSILRKGGYSEIWICGIRIVQVTIVV